MVELLFLPALPQGREWDQAWWVCRTLQRHGRAAVAVGGAVRDLLLGEPVADVDVATDADPDEVLTWFDRCVPVGKQFGVVIVLTPDGGQVEVASFRADGVYIDGRRPTGVVPTSEAGDVARRDFTCNALVLDPAIAAVRDHVGGLADLRHGLLRVVGDPAARLREDRLRVLRGLRFAARYDLAIDPPSWQALVATPLTGLSRERIWDEWTKALTSAAPGTWWRLLTRAGHQGGLHPALAELDATACAAIADQLDRLPAGSDPECARALQLAAVPDAELRDFLHQEPVSRALRDRLLWLHAHRDHRQAPPERAAWRRLLRSDHGHLLPQLWAGSGMPDPDRSRLQAELEAEASDPVTPLLNAQDLQGLGVPRGPELGATIRALADAQLAGRLRTVAEAEAWVADRLARSDP